MQNSLDLYSLTSVLAATIMVASIVDVASFHFVKKVEMSVFFRRYLVVASLLAISSFADAFSDNPIFHVFATLSTLGCVGMLSLFARRPLRIEQSIKSGDFNINSVQSIIDGFELIGRHTGNPEISRLAKKGEIAREWRKMKGRSIRSVVTRIRPIITEVAHPCKVEFDCSDTGRVGCQRDALELLVLNLITNARDSMPNGGVIRFSSRNCEAGVCLSVSDNGGGMSQDIEERAFEAFYSTKSKQESCGLGLTLVKAVADECKGRVLVSTGEGGTSVNVSLPVSSKQLIMVVDDDPFIAEMTREMIQNLGHDTSVASSGVEALRKLQEDDYDCVVMDFAMPDMNGVEVALEMARKGIETPVVFASGFMSDDMLNRLPISPQVLRKPFTERDLSKVLSSK